MNYDFDERTDEPKRYCPVSKLSQQEMPKTDEPRCRYCCERLVTNGKRYSGFTCCISCKRVNQSVSARLSGGQRARHVRNGTLTRLIVFAVRKAAKKKGKEFDSIDAIVKVIEQALASGCAMCGCALRLREAKEGGPANGCLQVDCIDPQRGYVVGNMQGLCPTCNRQKDNHTLETAERLYKHLLAHEYKRKYGFELHHLPVKPTLPAEPPEVPTRG